MLQPEINPLEFSIFVEDARPEYYKLANSLGEITQDYDYADIIMFTGGQDISPSLYGEESLEKTLVNRARDAYEVSLFWRTFTYPKNTRKKKAYIGICRGAQLLSVLSGASLWQDVSGHKKPHNVVDLETSTSYRVTSTHHQMIRLPRDQPSLKAQVLAVATDSTHKIIENTNKVYPKSRGNTYHDKQDIEAVWFPETRSLCYQPHPEFSPSSECAELFKKYVYKYVYPSFIS